MHSPTISRIVAAGTHPILTGDAGAPQLLAAQRKEKRMNTDTWSIISRVELSPVVCSARRASAMAVLVEESGSLLEREYRRFLALACERGGDLPMLSPAVDEVWHAHLLRSADYRALCAELGVTIDHEPTDGGAPIDQAEADAFRNAYERAFAEPPPEAIWTGAYRCRGKPCHAPTTCRCRCRRTR
jgi:hypothetical protein